jgi:TRAP-type C4-dicarboxylate transport system permease small subunit
MKLVQRLDAFLNTAEKSLLVLFLGVMVLLAFLQVVLRNVFAEGILWADILLRHLVLWIGFIGAALATSSERHISIDVFARLLSPRVKSLVRSVTNLFAIIICYAMMEASVQFIAFEIEDKSTVYGAIPAVYAQIIIPAGYGLLAIHFLFRFIISSARFIRPELEVKAP